MTGVARERDWQVSIKWVILSTWLLQFSSAKVILWWVFTWDTTSSWGFLFIQRDISTYLFHQISPSPIFQSCSYQVPDQPASPWICVQLHIWPFPLPRKVNSQVHSSKFCSLGGFLFTAVLQGYPRKGLWCCNCPLSGGACILCRTIYQPGLGLLFLCQLILGKHRCRLGERRQCSRRPVFCFLHFAFSTLFYWD